MGRVNLLWCNEELFDDYYFIRCDSTDIYWMGHRKKPDYETLKECYMKRLDTCRFSEVGDKRILLVHYISNTEERNIGQVLLTITSEGIEIGISVLQEYQGLGIGTDVIKQVIEIAKQYSDIMIANIRDDNFASQKSFQKNGFQRTNEYVINDYPCAGQVKFRKYILTISPLSPAHKT